MVQGMQVTLISGRDDLEVVGESYYQDNLWDLVGGRTGGRVRKDVYVLLVAEQDNPYDPNAVSVWAHGLKVGHLSRDDAVLLRPGLLVLQQKHRQAIALAGVIVGGGENEGRAGLLGVFLNFDAADFGVSEQSTAMPAREEFSNRIRTGLSNAVASDEADDSYDLAWLQRLSDDPIKRIPQLRRLVASETDPISRHYAFALFEDTLYKCRLAFTDALEEYDRVCRQHDSEMTIIQPTLVAKFGVVPLLDTYRQAAIRYQKAKDMREALWWAERGIALYGDIPAKPEMLFDLNKRAAAYRAKLDPLIDTASAEPPEGDFVVMESLTCHACGGPFERKRARGRKPLACPACRQPA
jgi:hypothetical protein